jgi:8-amino-7-oxononanoate synthase
MLAALMGVQDDLETTLADLERDGLLRRPSVLDGRDRARGTIRDRPVVTFCSNDYLGLAGDPRLTEAAAAAARAHGVGAGASRLVSGTHPTHLDAERALADWVDRPAALLFSSGYAANVGALSTLLGRGDVAFSDALNHASLIDGLRLSRADVHVYPHAVVDPLAHLLREYRPRARRAWIVTDAVFSMDGDLAPLAALRALANAHDVGFYVDEAHALGVLGDGRGACQHLGVVPDALVGTLGKSTGAAGAFVAGTHALRTLLENRARSYVFSTGVPPMIAATLCTAVRLARDASEARARLRRHGQRIRAALRAQGWTVPEGETPIIPVVLGSAARTMAASASLLRRGYFVGGIRPPTVPPGTSRLRVVPTAAHTDADVDGLIQAFGELAR